MNGRFANDGQPYNLERHEKALHIYDQTHKVWMQTSRFHPSYKIIEAKVHETRAAYEAACLNPLVQKRIDSPLEALKVVLDCLDPKVKDPALNQYCLYSSALGPNPEEPAQTMVQYLREVFVSASI